MSLDPKEAGDVLEKMIRGKIRIPLCFIGAKGIGKSAIVKEVANKLNFKCLDVRLALDTPEDISGWPRPQGDSVKYLVTDWFNEAQEAVKTHDGVIIFFDEPNRSHADTRQALFEIMTEFSIRRKKLPPNAYIVFAMNPDNGEYEVETLNPAFERRMIRIIIEPSHKSWLEWAKGRTHRSVSEFIEKNPKFLYTKENCEINASFNPDAWRMVSDILEVDFSRNELTNILIGTVGKEAAAMFLKFSLENIHSLTPDALFEMSREEIKDYCEKLIKEKSYAAVISSTCDNIAQYVNCLYEKSGKLDNKKIYNILFYWSLIPPEFSSALINKVSEKVVENIHENKDEEIINLRRRIANKLDGNK